MKTNKTAMVVIISLLIVGFMIYTGYVANRPAEELKAAYKAAEWVEWTPTEEQKMVAWEAAGRPMGTHYEVLWAPEGTPRGPENPKKPLWMPAFLWKEPVPKGKQGIVIALSHEQWRITNGHELTDSQRGELKGIYAGRGTQAASDERVQMASDYYLVRSLMAGREPVSPEAITEAGMRHIERVGIEEAKGMHIKVYYTSKGEPQVASFTEEEVEELGEFELSQAQIDWTFR